MTDGDRYSRGLGRSFKAIRPRLCSEHEPDSVQAGLIVEYLLKMLREAVPNLGAFFRRASEEIARPNFLFSPVIFLKSEQKSSPYTLGLEHLLEGAKGAFERGGSAEDILSDLARRAVSGLITLLKYQKDYKEDVVCLKSVTRLAPLVEVQLYGKLAEVCGVAPRAERVPRKPQDQAALLNLPIAVL